VEGVQVKQGDLHRKRHRHGDSGEGVVRREAVRYRQRLVDFYFTPSPRFKYYFEIEIKTVHPT
jgi:hypothetical protein